MYLKEVKRKCDVRGCKCTRCFSISRTRESGQSVIMCEDCIRETLKAIQSYEPAPKRTPQEAPPLFFSDSVEDVCGEDEHDETAEEKESVELIELTAECSKCGKTYKSAQAYEKHVKACKGGSKT